MLVDLGRSIDHRLVLLKLKIIDRRDDDVCAKSCHDRCRGVRIRPNSPCHVVDVASTMSSSLPGPIVQDLSDGIPLCPIWMFMLTPPQV